MTGMHEDAAIWLKAGYQIWASGGEPARLPEQLSRETGLPAKDALIHDLDDIVIKLKELWPQDPHRS